jgi:organic hydroperoxide reductase OsmC/OhrA
MVSWSLGEGDFAKRRYSRVHTLVFEGGLTIEGSASPNVVPAPYSRVDAVDPEAAFTASISACHMLWFLDHAARAGFTVEAYVDEAEGTLARNTAGKLAMTRVTLSPAVTFAGSRRPSDEELAALHGAAHTDCFIANSVTTEVVVITR